MKKYLKGLGRNEDKAARVIAITMKDRAKHLVDNLDREEDWVRTLAGFVVMDEDMVGQEIDGVKVVANAHSMMTYIKNEIVDEVYIDVNESIRSHLNPMVMHLEDMGITVHIRIEVLDGFDGYSTSLGMVGSVPVVTFANREFDYKMLAVKRAMDIAGSIVGMLIMLIAMIFVVPAIKIESKGPVFLSRNV